MITVRPVLEIPGHESFGLWPVSDVEPFTFLALDGTLAPDGVGTAVMALASCNDLDPGDDRPSRPDDPLGGFLHGLLTMDPLFAAGGLQVTDTVTGTRLVPAAAAGWRTGATGGTSSTVTAAPRGSVTIPRPPPNATAPRSA